MEADLDMGKPALALSIIAVILLAVNLAVALPLYLSAEKVTVKTPAPTTPTFQLAEVERSRFLPYPTPSEIHSINVVGRGTVKAKPDRAIINFSVVTRGETAGEAYTLNTERMNAVIKALKEAGILEKQLETTGYRLSPVYKYAGGESLIISYECKNSLKVTLKDLSIVGRIIDLGVKAGANSVSSVSFTLSEEAREELKLKALSLAVEDAKAKAQAIAEAAGVTLVGPVSMSLSEPGPVRPMIMKAETPAPPEIIAPEELTVTVTVTAVYEFR